MLMREEIIGLLDTYRVKEALEKLAAFATSTAGWQVKDEVEALQTSYRLMLQYTAQGMKDPGKGKLYDQIVRTAYELTERIHILSQLPLGTGLYNELLRTYQRMPAKSFADLQLQLEAYTEDMATAPLLYADEHRRQTEVEQIKKRHEAAVDDLFEKIWISLAWNEAEAVEARTLCTSPLVQVNDLAVMMGAVTMSLLTLFDVRKLNFLLDAYDHTERAVNQRALVGIALCCYYHTDAICRYPEVMHRIALLKEEERFVRDLYHVQIQLLQSSRETQKIDKKMREEIIPEMMKNPMLKKYPRLGIEETDESADYNPEWQEWIDKSQIGDKLHELGELQLAGADVYMSTFSQLKTFPFFRKIAHWFYPFDNEYPGIAELPLHSEDGSMSMLSLMVKSTTFCNSDKYSFCFAVMQMPESQRKFLIHQVNAQQEASEELKERLQEMMKKDWSPAREVVSRLYIQDLYRFFKLWMRKHELHDIFRDGLDLWNNPLLKDVLYDKAYITQLADYLFTHHYLSEAGELYDKAISLYHSSNAELWQKTGYIYQQSGDCDKALRYYAQADLLQPDNVWNNRHMAQCYKRKGDFAQALDYYRKVEAVQPDSTAVTFQIGQCLMELERYDEALACFFKVEYLDKKPQNARRAIGWCSFITGKHQQAKKYYDLLIAEPNPIREDWMNAGHVCYLLGEVPQAIAHYRKAQELCGSREEFVNLYLSDRKELLKQGMDETDVYILPDALI